MKSNTRAHVTVFPASLLVAVVLCGIGNSVYAAASNSVLVYTRFSGSNPAFVKDLRRIEDLTTRRDLEGLVVAGANLQVKWGGPSDADGYFALSDKLINGLESCCSGLLAHDIKVQTLMRNYIMLTLAHKETVPVDVKVSIVPHLIWLDELEYNRHLVKPVDWMAERTAHAKLWFEIFLDLDQAIDKNYDFKTMLTTNIGPFLGDPNDAKAYAAYQKAGVANNRKLLQRTDQYTLRRMLDGYSDFAEHSIVAYYTRPPYALPELKQYLDLYVSDPARKSRILDPVLSAMAEHPEQRTRE